MPTLERLTRRSEFLRTASARQKWVTPGVIVQARSRVARESGNPSDVSDDQSARFGLTVSRKVGNAVTRNRVRRRLRAIARDVLPEVGRAGTDYVLIGRQATTRRTAADLRQDIETAVRCLNARLDGTARPNRKQARDSAKQRDGGAETPQ